MKKRVTTARARCSEQSVLSVWRDQLAQATAQPGFRHQLLRAEQDLLPRFAAHYTKLAALPRRARRSLQRQSKRSLAGVALLLALGQGSALAATITVDGVTCTLANALTAANQNLATGGCPAGSGADTIVLPANSTQTLTSINNDTYGPTGLPEVTSEITIEGHGSTIAKGSSAPPFRIFAVSFTGNLTLKETTVSGGSSSTPGRGGGGVFSRGALSLIDSTISGNTAFAGGGVSSQGTGSTRSTLSLVDSTISGNTAMAGGGVNSGYGTLTVTNSTISNNSILSGGGVGGGIAIGYGTLTVTNSTISNNSIPSSGSSGGGVFSTYTTFNLIDSTISGNSALGQPGGGLSNSQGELTVTNSTISGNTGLGGGGVSNGGTLHLTGSTVSGNNSIQGFGGGGILTYRGSTLTLTNSTISGNSEPGGRGGGLNNGGSATVTNSTISGNSAGEGGGGVYDLVNSASLTLSHALVSGNRAPSGAEIYNAAGVAVSANDFNVLGHSGLTNVQAFRRFAPGASDITATSNGNTPKALGAILNTTLASNGGPTRTHALVIGSPAIDAVGSGCPPPNTDQRGTSRPQGSACDVGAFEAPFVPTAAAGSLQFSAAAVSVNEGGANATITVTRTGGSNGAVTVNYTTANATGPNSATAGADYTFTQGFVTFPDGDATNKSFQVPILDDGDVEPSETVALSLSNATNGATFGTPNKALLTITDNDGQVTCAGRTATLVGTAGNDTLTGTARDDVINSLAGNDVINGLAGNDRICGDVGNDTLKGGPGNDSLSGGDGNDRLLGAAGNDAMDGGNGTADTCAGGAGRRDTTINCETATGVP